MLPGHIHLWRLRLDGVEHALPAALSRRLLRLLPAAEAQPFASPPLGAALLAPAVVAERLLSRALVRVVLSRYINGWRGRSSSTGGASARVADGVADGSCDAAPAFPGVAPHEVALERAAGGKPHLAARQQPGGGWRASEALHFSVSHCPGCVLLAVSAGGAGPLGVDVEPEGRAGAGAAAAARDGGGGGRGGSAASEAGGAGGDAASASVPAAPFGVLRAAMRYFSPAEAAALRAEWAAPAAGGGAGAGAAAAASSALRLWTLKEALLKATGEGIARGRLAAVALSLTRPGPGRSPGGGGACDGVAPRGVVERIAAAPQPAGGTATAAAAGGPWRVALLRLPPGHVAAVAARPPPPGEAPAAAGAWAPPPPPLVLRAWALTPWQLAAAAPPPECVAGGSGDSDDCGGGEGDDAAGVEEPVDVEAAGSWG